MTSEPIPDNRARLLGACDHVSGIVAEIVNRDDVLTAEGHPIAKLYEGSLTLRLPPQRSAELASAGQGRTTPAGDWFVLTVPTPLSGWHELIRAARDYVKSESLDG